MRTCLGGAADEADGRRIAALAVVRNTCRKGSRAGAAVLAGIAFVASFSYLGAAYWLVFVARVGPTEVVIDASSRHGVHAGDLLALPLVLLAGITFFGGVLAVERAVRPRTRTPWRIATKVAPTRAPTAVRVSPVIAVTPIAPVLTPLVPAA